MKTLVAVVVLAGTIGIGIGAARAGESRAADEVPLVRSGGIVYRAGLDTEGGGWAFGAASETGALPAARIAAPRAGGGTEWTSAGAPSGGVTYRVGIDTGP